MGLRSTLAGTLPILLALTGTNLEAQEGLTVGITTDCDVQIGNSLSIAPLNEAIAQGNADEFRLGLPELRGDLVIDRVNTQVRGGFSSCAAAAAQAPQGGRTILRGSGNRSVILIDGGDGTLLANPASDEFPVIPMEIFLQNLVVTGGDGGAGGGINITGAARVRFDRGQITGNRAEFGGGVRIRGALSSLQVARTVIDKNLVTDDGGGIFCSAQASVTLDNETIVHDNQAEFMGGGVFASACRLEAHGVVSNNRAGSEGGGIAAISGSKVDLVGLRAPMQVKGNAADYRLRGEGAGGGLYIGDQHTSLLAENTHVLDNTSGTHGGGLFLEGRAEAVLMQAVETGCGQADCSLIAGNQVGLAGEPGEGSALLVTDGARIELLQTAVTNHTGDHSRSIIAAKRAGASIIIESSLVFGNHPEDDIDHVFDIAGTAELTIALSTVAGNGARQSIIKSEDARTELVGSVLMDSGSLDRPYFSNNPDLGLVTARHLITYPAAELSGVSIKHAGMEVFNAPEIGDFHLNNEPETVSMARNQLLVGEYALQIPRDYRQQDRSVREFSIGVIDIGPDEYPLVAADAMFEDSFEPDNVIRFNQQLAGIFRHTRCTTCHAAASVPESVTTRFTHAGQELGTCAGGCHSGTGGSLDLSNWHTPDNMRLEGLTDRQLCQLAKRDAVPGEVSGQAHLVHDNLILWAVTSGKVPGGGTSDGAAQPASDLDIAGWTKRIEDWFADGAHCE